MNAVNNLFAVLLEKVNVPTVAELARKLNVTEGYLSKIRSGKLQPSGNFILLVYDHTDMSIETIRALLKVNNG